MIKDSILRRLGSGCDGVDDLSSWVSHSTVQKSKIILFLAISFPSSILRGKYATIDSKVKCGEYRASHAL